MNYLFFGFCLMMGNPPQDKTFSVAGLDNKYLRLNKAGLNRFSVVGRCDITDQVLPSFGLIYGENSKVFNQLKNFHAIINYENGEFKITLSPFGPMDDPQKNEDIKEASQGYIKIFESFCKSWLAFVGESFIEKGTVVETQVEGENTILTFEDKGNKNRIILAEGGLITEMVLQGEKTGTVKILPKFKTINGLYFINEIYVNINNSIEYKWNIEYQLIGTHYLPKSSQYENKTSGDTQSFIITFENYQIGDATGP